MANIIRAPEVVEFARAYQKSDIFDFGILL
jgi:hypothetical protein